MGLLFSPAAYPHHRHTALDASPFKLIVILMHFNHNLKIRVTQNATDLVSSKDYEMSYPEVTITYLLLYLIE